MSAERERYSSFQQGSILWFAQRITAVFLIATLAFHFFLLHFWNHAADVTFTISNTRMSAPAYYFTMVAFLIAATFHGVNGVYNALVNRGITGTPRRAAKWLLAVAGVALIVQGIRVANALAGI